MGCEMKENKCNVQFICHGANCTYAVPFGKDYTVVSESLRVYCIHYVDGNCHCADAMIGALEAEGYEVKE